MVKRFWLGLVRIRCYKMLEFEYERFGFWIMFEVRNDCTRNLPYLVPTILSISYSVPKRIYEALILEFLCWKFKCLGDRYCFSWSWKVCIHLWGSYRMSTTLKKIDSNFHHFSIRKLGKFQNYKRDYNKKEINIMKI